MKSFLQSHLETIFYPLLVCAGLLTCLLMSVPATGGALSMEPSAIEGLACHPPLRCEFSKTLEVDRSSNGPEILLYPDLIPFGYDVDKVVPYCELSGSHKADQEIPFEDHLKSGAS